MKAEPVPHIGPQIPNFTPDDAYRIQEGQLALRLEAGEKQIGWKMGLTSEAKRRQMNLHSPLYGHLTDKMQVEGRFKLEGSIHPKIEPEVAFFMRSSLEGHITRVQAFEAVEAVAPCLEILDSRYQQFQYFSLGDVIADNSSSSHFVLGPWKKDFRRLKLADLEMKMFVSGQLAHSGNSKDISGDPLISIVQLCELLAERGQMLEAGSIVLAGAATPAVALEAGMKIRLEVQDLDSFEVEVTP